MNDETTTQSGWIDADLQLPPLLDGKDYSANVWGYDGHSILVVAFFNDANDFGWGNAYGNVFGDAEMDDAYNIKYWQPLLIPEPPHIEEK